MKRIKYVVFGLVSLISAQSMALDINGAKIILVSLKKSNGNFAFIKTDAPGPLSRVSCHTNGAWDFTIPLQTELDKAMYSAILTAYSTGRKVRLIGVGEGQCNEFSSVESIDMVRLLEQ